ncbi:T9SS type A sorting domain-containing protein [Saprospiraceae bacterium]|nr:T9SS type A sorting domain-containing protein [Saprospiraceae bacterium]
MNKYLLLCAFLLSAFALQSQSTIVHTDFGDGWVIGLNDNLAIDMDDDGINDFYVNKRKDELGFSGVFNIGCFASSDNIALSIFETYVIRVFDKGELIEMNTENFNDYFEDDASVYGVDEGHADGWVDNEDYYVGVVLINQIEGLKNAWMRVSIDSNTETLTIKDWAYKPGDFEGGDGILAGSKGSITSTSELVDINEVVISPNPVADRMNIKYNYVGYEDLSIGIYNTAGVEVYQQMHRDSRSSLEVDTETWAAGSYIVRFQTDSGVKAKQVLVVR